jgi:hypothetical protein
MHLTRRKKKKKNQQFTSEFHRQNNNSKQKFPRKSYFPEHQQNPKITSTGFQK